MGSGKTVREWCGRLEWMPSSFQDVMVGARQVEVQMPDEEDVWAAYNASGWWWGAAVTNDDDDARAAGVVVSLECEPAFPR